MKRLTALLLALALLCSFVPVFAEESPEENPGMRDQIVGFFTGVGNWVSDVAENAQQTAEDVADWAESRWQDVQDTAGDVADWAKGKWDDVKNGITIIANGATGTAQNLWHWVTSTWESILISGGETVRGAGNQLTNLWNSLSETTRNLFNGIRQFGKDIQLVKEAYEQLLNRGVRILVRETILEAVDLLEELALEKQADIPEDVKTILATMKEYSTHPDDMPDEFDSQSLDDFIAALGLEKEEYNELLTKRLETRITRLAMKALSAVLDECAAEKSINVSSAAKRALDRLTRYANGTLTMTEEEVNNANKIIDDWMKQNGITEIEVLYKVIDWAEVNSL